MGCYDVWLSERFGFAEIWNNYSIHKKDFGCCWGSLTAKELINAVSELKKLGESKHTVQEGAAKGSIMYQFRNLELKVGTFCAMKSVAKSDDKYEAKPAAECTNIDVV